MIFDSEDEAPGSIAANATDDEMKSLLRRRMQSSVEIQQPSLLGWYWFAAMIG
jgi:hypothetical protein